MTWQFVLAGLFTGLLVGMTGMGGGSLMTPILVFIFGIPPSTAIGTDIAHGAVFKSVGAVQHRRMGNVRAKLAGWMLIGSIPASLAGVLGLAGIKLLDVPFAGTIVVVALSAGAVALLVLLARHSWIRFVRGRVAAAPPTPSLGD